MPNHVSIETVTVVDNLVRQSIINELSNPDSASKIISIINNSGPALMKSK